MNQVTYEHRPMVKARTSNDFGTTIEWNKDVVVKVEPSGAGVHNLLGDCPERIKVAPYGAGNPLASFWLRIHCWNVTGQSPTWIWARTTVAVIGCVLSSLPELTGLEGCVINATERFAGTESGIQYSVVAIPPCQKIEFEFLKATNEPVGMNALWSRV